MKRYDKTPIKKSKEGFRVYSTTYYPSIPLSDSDILSVSRYTGIALNRALEEGVVSINGTGLQLYLGDGQSKGLVIAESKNTGKVRVYTNTTLAESLFNSTVSSGKPFGIDET